MGTSYIPDYSAALQGEQEHRFTLSEISGKGEVVAGGIKAKS